MTLQERLVEGMKDAMRSGQLGKGGGADLAAKEEPEVAILQTFLPPPLSDDELAALVREAAADVGASGPKDMGKVMKAGLPRVAGRAEGGAVNAAGERD